MEGFGRKDLGGIWAEASLELDWQNVHETVSMPDLGGSINGLLEFLGIGVGKQS
jgi:hypothetical protein